MRFFVPGEEDAEAAWEQMRQACGAPEDTRPSYSVTYERGGTEVLATVGEEGVVAIIFASEAFDIFEGLGNPRSVSFESITEMAFFDDE